MTIVEQIKSLGLKKGQFVEAAEIRSALEKKYGTNPTSIIPSDLSYNRTNKGIDFEKHPHLFEYVKSGEYKYLGELYPYTGNVYRRDEKADEDIIVGRWENGSLVEFSTK